MSTPLPRRVFVALLPTNVADFPSVAPNSGLPVAVQGLSTAVVIDTLRFTTTACRALEVGARAVHVASSVEQARQLAAELAPPPLLCGERHCHPIEGFDLGNSPFEYTREKVQDRDLVFTTTNGTLAIAAVQHVPRILLAALVNRQAVCRQLADTSGDILIVCAGTDGQVTWEDVLTAGAIVDGLLTSENFEVGHDPVLLAHTAWQATIREGGNAQFVSSKLFTELSRALGGRNLLTAGYQRDLQFAAQLDTIEVVPQNSPQQPQAFQRSPAP